MPRAGFAQGFPPTIGATPAGRRTHRVALIASLLLVTLAIATVPVARQPGPDIPALLPILGTGTVIADLVTFYLLYNLGLQESFASLAVLASRYLFTAGVAAALLAVFPGVLAPDGLLGAGPQTVVWLWALGHLAAALYALAYVGLAWREHREPERRAAARRRTIALAALLLATALVVLTTQAHDLLPPLTEGGHYGPAFLRGVLPLVLAVNLATIALLVARTRLVTAVQTWLCVALLANCLELILTGFAGARFSLGWYSARLDYLLGSVLMLAALQRETIRLYRHVLARNRRLSRAVAVDGLTGLANRRQFDRMLAIEARRSARLLVPLSVLMADLDHFKSFNDALGHLAGDECLKAVARTLRNATGRPADLVARYGGEEFVLLLPATDEAGAAEVARRIEAETASLGIAHPTGIGGVVTLSIGIATALPLVAGSELALLERADAMLYAAKAAGRARICWAPDPNRLDVSMAAAPFTA